MKLSLHYIKRKKFLYRLFLSYVIVVVLLSVMSVAVYRSAYKDVWDKSLEIGNRTAESCKTSVDALFLDIEQLTQQIMQEPRIQTLEEYRAPYTEEERKQGLLLSGELNKYMVSEQELSSIYIYFPGSNMMVHQGGIYDASHVYKIHYKSEEFSYEDFLAVLNDTKKISYTKLRSTVATEPQTDLLVYVREAVNGLSRDNVARIVACVPQRRLFQDSQTTGEVENKMFILSQNREIIFSSDESYRELLAREDFALEDPVAQRINGGKDTLICLKSDVVDWYYAVVMQTDALQQDVSRMKRMMWYNILLMIAVGVVLIILFVKVNYKPVDELLEQLKDMGLPVDKKGNELEEVFHAVSTISQERHGLDAMVEKQSKVLKNHALRKLLLGKKADPETLCEKYEIVFPFKHFTVCTFFAKNLDTLFNEDNDLDAYDRNELFFQIIKNIIEELMNRQHRAYVTEIDNVISCIININDEREDCFLKDINLSFREAREVIAKYFNVDIVAAMGEIHQGLAGVSLAYTESVQTMDYKIFMEINGLTTYSSIPEYDQTEPYFSVENEKQLINFMMIGDGAKAEELLNDIIYINLMERALSVKSLNILMMKIVTIYFTVMQSPQINEEVTLHTEISSLVEMIGTESFQAMQSKAMEILRQICQLNNKKKTTRGNRKMDEIVAFIDQNYAVPGLNVNLIAEQFEFNAAYLSKRFKEECGESLLYYINKVRIKEAKELLKQGTLTYEEIAVRVGFTNSRTFLRAFKRYEGISPGEYRKGYHTSFEAE